MTITFRYLRVGTGDARCHVIWLRAGQPTLKGGREDRRKRRGKTGGDEGRRQEQTRGGDRRRLEEQTGGEEGRRRGEETEPPTVFVPTFSMAQGSSAVSPLWKVTLLGRGRKTGMSGSMVTPILFSVNAARQLNSKGHSPGVPSPTAVGVHGLCDDKPTLISTLVTENTSNKVGIVLSSQLIEQHAILQQGANKTGQNIIQMLFNKFSL